MTEDAQVKTETGAEVKNTIKKGDIVQLELDAWIGETGKLFQTTSKENARKEGIYDERTVYGPVYEVVGKNRFFPGLEKSIVSAGVGEEVEVSIRPEEAAGSRDPALVRLYSVREFERMNVEPKVGEDVRIGDRVGRITQVTVGRVRVDFNNPLAGHSLKYRYKILRKVEEREEKLRAFLEMYYGTDTGFEIAIDGDTASITLPDSCKLDTRWLNAKLRVVAEAYDSAGLKEVRFVEKYVKSAPETAAEKGQEGKAEEKGAEENLSEAKSETAEQKSS
jgi:FKBP-type peptidyl-prolyl cis-trans isomerase 2